MTHERLGASARDQEPSLPPPPSSASHTTNSKCEIPLRHPSPGAAYRRHRSSRSRNSQDIINAVVPAPPVPVPVPCPSALPPVRHGPCAESERLLASQRSQRELSDADARVVYVGDPDRTDPGLELVGNDVRTAKYSLLTFLPRNLFEQFHRLAYVYFLVITILNQLPQLAVFGRGASIVPLSIVLVVTAIKDAYEDWRRHHSDRIENLRAASVLDPVTRQFRSKPWKDVRIGEVVKVQTDETIPCDMVILSSSDPTGIAYVQTTNLDGESNLKTRYAKHETMSRHPDGVHLSGGLIHCEQPNRNMYGFLANMEVDAKRVSLGPPNIILRGCELKNTEWVAGVVVYAGCETKVMLNSSGAPSKRSRLETRMNRETLLLSTILIFICSVVSVYNGLWLGEHRDALEMAHFFRQKDYSTGVATNYNYYGVGMEVFFTFLMSVIVLQIMIPISLYISMELVRLGQAYFMIGDANLYDEGSKSRFQCRALNINEDLGQIKYVFSDKTGTLTENKMVFQCASIHGIDYSGGKGPSKHNEEVTCVLADDGQIWRPKMPVKTDPELVELLRSEGHTEQGHRAREFFLALACCNTIVPLVVEESDPKQRLIDYQGESPDEQALVYAAASYGFVLVERTSGHIVIDALGDRQRYEVLGLHEFDSDRKRMSVIIRCPDKTVKLFMKGADSSMLGIIEKTENQDIIHATERNLHAYSSLGLRTLVVGVRNLTRNEFEEWQSAYDNASTALIGRGKLLRAVASDVERCLDILGASAIEDKLQQGVPEAIQSMRLAGIKVWVLTGDKQETAISIGFSCKLLTAEMTQIVINSNSAESCKRSLKDAVAICSKLTAMSTDKTLTGSKFARIPMALIIDGTSLVYILETDLQQELFKVATACEAVLCCRVAPLQKAGIVALTKDRTDDMTLAIGDGANDVSMIQMADVGIGISGQEGRQAVMASDFAMGQFRFLVPLLLVHGHWNYQRMAYMILYNFYRNGVFVFILFWYVLYTAYSLTTAISEWSTVLYSIVYTALPTIIVGILDKDLNRGTLMKYPQLYKSGQRNERYNLKLFILTMVDCIWQSLAIFYIPYLAYEDTIVDGSSLGDLWILAVVILVNIRLAMDVYRWNWITHAAIWGSIIVTIVCVFVIDSAKILPGYWAIFHLIGTGLFWLCLFGILIAGMVPRFTTKVLTEFLMPSDIQIAREVEKFRGTVATPKTSPIALSQP